MLKKNNLDLQSIDLNDLESINGGFNVPLIGTSPVVPIYWSSKIITKLFK
ncbi:hypothetical protein ACV3P9_15200 [Clostridium perfringens]|nr:MULTISPECIES: hypothetical protein [Clostridia]ELP5188406.1 hypothetical protein [Clostridium perfringens]MBW4863580.1 hypothetical protein [Paeniclostridium sp.]MDM0675605.1 hypothetical protein [Clostridium perfringens]MDM0907024.1 hypothetical protein [Clostridium perfringens]MDM0950527.1 hypothetical protein [Clostridium perfringens]